LGALKSLAQAFIVATGLVWLFNLASLLKGSETLLGLTYLLILLIPISSVTCFKLKDTNSNPKNANEHFSNYKNLLFSFQGIALAFWMFDITTTFYSINITGLAVELNPLGWPLGILGGFAYYAPVLIFSFVLLSKYKERVSYYTAILLTILTLGMGSMNLIAGVQNFQIFVYNAALVTGISNALLPLLIALNLLVPLVTRKMLFKPKTILK
jgi:hypothetical protein